MARYRPTPAEWVLVPAAGLLSAVLAWGAIDFGLGYFAKRPEPEYANPWVGLVTVAFAVFFVVVVIAWWRARFRGA